GSRNSNTDLVYDFYDKTPPAVAYYRLKQVDIDGKFDYSTVVQVVREIPTGLVATMANPVTNSARINISTDVSGSVSIRVIDLQGREISTQVEGCTRGSNIIMKDFSRLPGGNYYLVVTQGENRIVKPFIKQ
ncbi:MAG: T9SS type A sorting domain-containing protein, partial [Bacteroidota bacterium]